METNRRTRHEPRTVPFQARLQSVGVPERARSYLEDTWVRTPGFRCGRVALRSATHGMELAHDGTHWRITWEGLPLARAASDALHPNTIYRGEWQILELEPAFAWVEAVHFGVVVPDHFAATEQQPWDLHDVGHDVFLRRSFHRPIWFLDPTTGKACHSGATHQGVRYCHLCRRCLSGKNFGQHLGSDAHIELQRQEDVKCEEGGVEAASA